MRISDWSSDVCSSDLLGVGDQIETGIGETQCLHVLATHAVMHAAGRDAVEILGQQQAARMPHQMCHQRAARGQFIGIARAELRSEEHTSELQSLMRNSYAVLCLTKKT